MTDTDFLSLFVLNLFIATTVFIVVLIIALHSNVLLFWALMAAIGAKNMYLDLVKAIMKKWGNREK